MYTYPSFLGVSLYRSLCILTLVPLVSPPTGLQRTVTVPSGQWNLIPVSGIYVAPEDGVSNLKAE